MGLSLFFFLVRWLGMSASGALRLLISPDSGPIKGRPPMPELGDSQEISLLRSGPKKLPSPVQLKVGHSY